jgi:integrase
MKACLTTEYVDSLIPPEKGEFWIGDEHLRHFGVRGWTGKKGGNVAFAIRLRNGDGRLIRETFDIWRDHLNQHWVWRRGNYWEKPLSHFLDPARRWARDRIAFHYGYPTTQQIREARWERERAKTLATTLRFAIDYKLKGLRTKSKNHEYVDRIQMLVDLHIPEDVLSKTFKKLPVRQLGDAITERGIGYGNIRVLRSFIGSVVKEAARHCGPLHNKLESLQRRCAKNLDAQKSPPYPEILKITPADYQEFFDLLERDVHWRQALAIRLYFATGAKMQQVLKARWSDIVDDRWFPFVPKERKLWSDSVEHLNPEALAVIKLIEYRHGQSSICSKYLFPSELDAMRHITTVQRHWVRLSGTVQWTNLPISHVVLRHRPRSNPSYYLYFISFYRIPELENEKLKAVSKVENRRKDSSINAITY